MTFSTEKTLDYRCFLLGIILCWMFDVVWASFATCFFALESVLNPIAVILAVVAVHFFINHYLGIILFEHCTPNIVTSQHGALFDNVANCCDWALPIAAFILYRKEMKQPTL